MAISRENYGEISCALQFPVGCCLDIDLVAVQHPGVARTTVLNIFAQENQTRVKKDHHMHKISMPSYLNRYRDGEDILQVCADVDFPPYLMLRLMLEHILHVNKQRAADILKNPAILDSYAMCTAEGNIDYHLLLQLRGDIDRCVRADRCYSPLSDMAKQLAGLEHEALLHESLYKAGVTFWDEAQLRERGMFKTPDAWLQVPILVRAQSTATSNTEEVHTWHVVHWIDSKATFGDDRTHSTALSAQYTTYTNRYGPGAVIYWFGYIADLASSDPDVLVLAEFPTADNIRMLPQLDGLKGGRGPSPEGALHRSGGAFHEHHLRNYDHCEMRYAHTASNCPVMWPNRLASEHG